jgi:hypothetical protein
MKRRINNLCHEEIQRVVKGRNASTAHVLSQQSSKCLCLLSEVDGIPCADGHHSQLLFPFVSNKLRSKLFSMRVDTWEI